MVAIMWQFTVKDRREDEFEQFFGADGEWNATNRLTRSFLGTSFLRDQTSQLRYILIEYWSEMVVYEQHRAYRSDALVKIEEQRDSLVEAMEPMGVFTALDVPERSGPTWSQRG
jgi:quinol monooxygenase YgiN